MEVQPQEVGDDKSEMTEAAVKSSPVWRFFKPDLDNENHVRCLTCDKVIFVMFSDMFALSNLNRLQNESENINYILLSG